MAPPARAHSGPRARFDDMVDGRGLVLRGFERAVVAKAPEEVTPALLEAEAAAAGGSWVGGFVAYEAAAGLDPTLATRPPELGAPEVPLVWFGVFSEARAEALDDDDRPAPETTWCLDTDAGTHASRVADIRARIAAGDVYQCNLTARYRTTFDEDPLHLYRRLAAAQRSAHCAFVDTGELAVASASPELFFDWTGDALVTRPMKGTARRGRRPDEDRELAAALQRSTKDRAENVMIVDLLRNDLGKIARFGSVTVETLCALERYESVWQLTSTVTARTPPGTRLIDVFQALFPSGSVTGAPKGSAMATIAALEDTPRGVYCGAIGLVPPAGIGPRARFSVGIRTAIVDRCTGLTEYGSGGGIVWDSDAGAEFAELQTKAELLRASHGEFQLLETVRALPGRTVCRWAQHRERLLASAAHFGFAVCADHLDRCVRRAAEGLTQPARLRVLAARDGTVRVEADPIGPAGGTVHLEIDDEPVEESGPWLFHKTTRRDMYERRAARHPAADQVVLVNGRGQATETTVANLAVKLGGRWWTPPVESGCLPGVLRAQLIASGAVGERPVTVEELRSAEGLAVISSLRGWRPARLRT